MQFVSVADMLAVGMRWGCRCCCYCCSAAVRGGPAASVVATKTTLAAEPALPEYTKDLRVTAQSNHKLCEMTLLVLHYHQ